MPTSRSVTTPVLTMNKMLLGEHSILIDDSSDAAVADILKATAAAAIVDKFHSADFQKLTIKQMGDAQIEINESVRTRMNFLQQLTNLRRSSVYRGWSFGK